MVNLVNVNAVVICIFKASDYSTVCVCAHNIEPLQKQVIA